MIASYPDQRRLRAFLAAAVAIAALSVASPASALTVASTSPEYTTSNHEVINGLSRADCDSATAIIYDLTFETTEQGSEFSVWVADGDVSCAATVQRVGDTAVCFEVTTQTQLINDITLNVPLDAGILNTLTNVNGCAPDSAANTDRQLTISFLVGASNTTDATTEVASKAFTYDLVGPDAPSITAVSPAGETTLQVEITGSADANLKGYNAYCDESLDDPAVCASNTLTAGEVPTGTPCNSSSNATTFNVTVAATTVIAIGVAGVDNYNNVGVLSELACGEGEPVDGFWSTYQDANPNVDTCTVSVNGTGSGGPRRGLPFGLLMLGVVVGALSRRRLDR